MTDFFLGEGPLRPGNAAVALIVVEETKYLLQLRDQKPGIFYPGHWGLFGGAIDAGETPERALQRELDEELGLLVTQMQYFTEIAFDFSFCGHGRLVRRVFEVPLERSKLTRLTLGEGAAMRLFTARQIFAQRRVVPYDAFALWLHATRRQAIGARTA